MRWLLLLGMVCPMLARPAPIRAEVTDGPVGSAYLRTLAARPSPFGRQLRDGFPYDGVRVQRWRRDDAPADWLIVWVDLRTPGLGYRVSPVHDRTGPAGTPCQAAYAQTTVDFLAHGDGPPVDLAINTVAYWPFPATDGMPVYLSEPVWQGDATERDPAAGSLMLGLLPGRAVLDDAAAVREARPQVAFGSFYGDERPEESVLVRRGELVRHGGLAHGRTAAGITADGRVLLLLIADGYNPGVSEGLSAGDAASLLQAAGAHAAVLLDGGGSSTLVGRGPDGRPVVVNRPAGLQMRPGTLRYVAVNLGLTGLRPSGDPLPAVADWESPFLVRAWEETVLQFRVRPVRATVVLLAAATALTMVIGRLRRRYRTARRT